MPVETDLLSVLLRADRPLTAKEIGAALGTSQPTVSRLISALGPTIARLGRARATRYALPRPLGTLGHQWPLFRVAPDARLHEAASLTALRPTATVVTPTADHPILGEPADTPIWPELPWFLDDLRPQGFLGRAFARRYGQAIGAAPDPTLWTADQVLTSLLTQGDDLPGDFILGNQMRERAQRRMLATPVATPAADRGARYAVWAAETMAGEVVGSSAGGEHPKFTAVVELADGVRHVIVKFTEATNSPAKRRWMDLLLSEHHALSSLAEAGLSAASTELVVAGERLCLEVGRFDREGMYGRRGVVSLASVDMAHYGLQDDWRRAADRLFRDRWITAESQRDLHRLHWFGGLIGNTDMHFGNAAFFLSNDRPLSLAPAYDMLPMHYRPASTGEVVTRAFAPPIPTTATAEVEAWNWALPPALACWQRIADDARVSLPFRKVASENRALVAQAAERFA